MKWSKETYNQYLYIKSVYPHWKDLINYSSYRIYEIYKNTLKREEKRKEREKEEQQYHQINLWEAGLIK